jgi:hypothetical protein
MLAMVCFLRRLAEFTTQMEPWTGILATDSKSLLETITAKPPEKDQMVVHCIHNRKEEHT